MRSFLFFALMGCSSSGLTPYGTQGAKSDSLAPHKPSETVDDAEEDPPPPDDPTPAPPAPAPQTPPPAPQTPPPAPQTPPPAPQPPPPAPQPPPPAPQPPPPAPQPPPAPPTPAPSTDACYPGPALDWSVCLPTVPASQAGYSYAAPLNGNPQYAAPERFLDLSVVDGNTQIAPNFTLDEIAQEWKGRYAVVQPHAIDRLQDMRDALGALVINSGYRSPDYNSGVGGATYSRHMYGDAFDINPSLVSLSTMESTCYAHGAGYVGVYVAHMHCDWRNDSISPVFYSAPSSSNIHFVAVLDAVVDPVPGTATLSAPAEGWDEGEPLREWIAFDEDGYAIDTFTGTTYEPPPEAASVEVWVGRAVVRTLSL